MPARGYRADVHKRFMDFVSPEPMSGCWLWTGKYNKLTGYGGFWHEGETILSHRAAWVLFRGPIPHRKVICHKCDTPACVNPDHLWVGTHKENSRDMSHKLRSGNPRAVLTPEQAKEIYHLFWEHHVPEKMLAQMFGVGRNAINYIRNKKTWTAYLPGTKSDALRSHLEEMI